MGEKSRSRVAWEIVCVYLVESSTNGAISQGLFPAELYETGGGGSLLQIRDEVKN